MKLRTVVLRSKLQLTRLAIRMRVALGEFATAKLPVNMVRVAESIAKHFGRGRSDSTRVVDSVRVVPNKRLNDTTGIADGGAPYFAEDYIVGAPTAQTYTLSGGFAWLLQKILVDVPVAQDAVVKVLPSKSINETVVATDDVNGAAAGDDQIMRFFKVTTDVALIADAITSKTVGKVLADAAAASSSGSLRMQNYTVDMSYFAEDYVGTSGSFS